MVHIPIMGSRDQQVQTAPNHVPLIQKLDTSSCLVSVKDRVEGNIKLNHKIVREMCPRQQRTNPTVLYPSNQLNLTANVTELCRITSLKQISSIFIEISSHIVCVFRPTARV